MSGYSRALDPVTQKGYFEKLSLLRLNKLHGPLYASCSRKEARFTDNICSVDYVYIIFLFYRETWGL